MTSKVVVSIFYSRIVVRGLSATHQYAVHTNQRLCSSEHPSVDQFRHDEAGTRVSRQLLMQSLVSLLYGIAVFVGLYFLHVPYP
jgi:predicted PurR-regulated permease PerM